VEPVFEQYKSFILASLHFSKLTLGTVAPQFTGMASTLVVLFLCMYYDTNYLPCPFLYFSIVF
jgi:hypothetical protein